MIGSTLVPPAAAPSVVPATQPDVQHEPDAEERRRERGAAVRDERERDPGDRKHPERHADVDHDLKREKRDDPDDEQAPEPVSRGGRDVDPSQEKHREEEENHAAPHEPELLADDGVDEVGVLLGKEREALLRSVEVALSREAPGADRHLGLDDLVRRSAGVVRISERDDAGPLVGFELVPEDGAREARDEVHSDHDDENDEVPLATEAKIQP